MDFASFGSAVGALKSAIELGKTALELRDLNKVAPTIADMNAKLLEVQNSLLAHNTQLLELQGKHFAATEELRKVNEAMVERSRYALVHLGDGVFTYRVNLAPSVAASGDEPPPQPEHYICQSCFDDPAGSRKVVLAPVGHNGSLKCFHCSRGYQVPHDRKKDDEMMRWVNGDV
ncbi:MULTISPECIES: hypothetical protein [unclassified Paraburkholderia]|uniref:hypothetical protein n=1 Tax=unclassified Paraburkholderia TaxID=2615204 RepID=UPI0016168483|nr:MULTISPECIES: hypothetical protein [unclassified Paraburkholderia]MBB5447113.1 formylmethanofuran dehydrogenase subunit E [Paraburkholderia sp. WSM4177]MBB5487654.1 formylmethanofuran dehydrogenase subunit E [Paraburkholderia sp. WSM4180]